MDNNQPQKNQPQEDQPRRRGYATTNATPPNNRNPQGNQGNQAVVEREDDPPVINQNPPVDQNRLQPVGEENDINNIRKRTNISSIPKPTRRPTRITEEIEEDTPPKQDEKPVLYLKKFVRKLSTKVEITFKVIRPQKDEKETDEKEILDIRERGESNGTTPVSNQGGRPKAYTKLDIAFLDLEDEEEESEEPDNKNGYDNVREDVETRPEPENLSNQSLNNIADTWKKSTSDKLQGLGLYVTQWASALPKNIHLMKDSKEWNGFISSSMGLLKGIKAKEKELRKAGITKEERELIQRTKAMLRKAIEKGCEQEPPALKELLKSLKPEERGSLSEEMLRLQKKPTVKLTKAQMTILGAGLMDGPKKARLLRLKKMSEHFEDDDQLVKIIRTGMKLHTVGSGKLGVSFAKDTLELPELQSKICKAAMKQFTKEMQDGTGYNRATGSAQAGFLNACVHLKPNVREVLMKPVNNALQKVESQCKQLTLLLALDEKKLNQEELQERKQGMQDLLTQGVSSILPDILEGMNEIELPEDVSEMIGFAYSSVSKRVQEDQKKKIKWDKTPEAQGLLAVGSILLLGSFNRLITSNITEGDIPQLMGGKVNKGATQMLLELSKVIQGLGTQKSGEVKGNTTESGKNHAELFQKHGAQFMKMLSKFANEGTKLLSPEEEETEDSDELEGEETESGESNQGTSGNLASVLQEIPSDLISAQDKKALLGKLDDEAYYFALNTVWQQILTKAEHDQNSKAEKDDVDFAFDRLKELLEPLVLKQPETPRPPEESPELSKSDGGINKEKQESPLKSSGDSGQKSSKDSGATNTDRIQEKMRIFESVTNLTNFEQLVLENDQLMHELGIVPKNARSLYNLWNAALTDLTQIKPTHAKEKWLLGVKKLAAGISAKREVVTLIISIINKNLDPY